jgi:outer membrane protein insertion porin family
MTVRAVFIFVLMCCAALSARAQTISTATTSTTTLPGGRGLRVSRTIELDPTNRSSCTLGQKMNSKVTLNLEGLLWDDWAELCPLLEDYLRVDRKEIDRMTARNSERLLARTGYFDAVVCTATVANKEMTCFMSPQALVREVDIDGDLPFVLLEEDIRRQIFLRPGVVLREDEDPIERQEKRVKNFLARNGFFESKVKVTTTEGAGGAEPNEALALLADVDHGVTVTVEKIEVEGELGQGIERAKLESLLKHYWVFKVFPRRFQPDLYEEDLDEIARRIRNEQYPEARVTGEYELVLDKREVTLKVKVDTGPRMHLGFVGNKAIDNDDLEDLATFREAESLDAVEVETTGERIREEYQKEGYFQVKVTPDIKDDGAGKFITYKIEEGPRAEIATLKLTGNKAFDEDTLRTETNMKTDTGDGWVDSLVKRDGSAIRSFYRLRGFASTVVDVERTIRPDGDLDVIFEIDEGPLRKVAKVEMNGLPKGLDIVRMTERMRLIEGAPYVEGRLVSDRREILTVLAASGYPQAVVNRKLKVPYKTEPGEAFFTYNIEPGPRSIFGGFLVRGAFRTRDSVIADELSLNPGEPLDLLALTDATQRLRSLGVFSSVDLRPMDQWMEGEETWLLVDVTERNQLTLDAVFGFSTDDLFSVGADFRDDNFIGRAIHLRLSARLSNVSEVLTKQKIGRRDLLNAEIHAPHPLGLPFNAEYNVFYLYEDKTSGSSGTLDGYTRRRVGAGVAISRSFLSSATCNLCPEVTGRLGYELSSVEGIDLGPNDDLTLLDTQNVTIARLVPSVAVRRLDSPVDPRKGYAADLRLEGAHKALGGPFINKATFWRFLSSVEAYYPVLTLFETELSETVRLGGPLVVAGNLVYALGHPFGGSNELPITETFDYGGDLSVRGIDERASVNAVSNANYLLRGSLELRYYFLQASFGSFQIAAISDAGSVARHLNQLTADPTVTAGAAFRYITPVGPLSVAYAVPVRRAAGIDDRGRLHISFGYSF